MNKPKASQNHPEPDAVNTVSVVVAAPNTAEVVATVWSESTNVSDSALRTTLEPKELRAVLRRCLPLWSKGVDLNGELFHELCPEYGVGKHAMNMILNRLAYRVLLPRETAFRIEKGYYRRFPTWTGTQTELFAEVARKVGTSRRLVQAWIIHGVLIEEHIRKRYEASEHKATPKLLAAIGKAYLETLKADNPGEVGLHKYLAGKFGITPNQAHFLLFQWRSEFSRKRFPRANPPAELGSPDAATDMSVSVR